MEAVFLLTSQPKSIMYGGKVAKKRVADQVGCDVRKQDNSPTFMRSLEKIEGTQRKAKKGHVTKTGAGKDARFQADTSTEIDWSNVIEKMDRGENVNDDIDELSWHISSGVPITTVAQILGHANASVTLKIYAHAIQQEQQQSIEAMRRLFG